MDSPPPVPPPPPPPLPTSSTSSLSTLSSLKSPHRITVDDLHSSPLLHSLTSANGTERRTSTNGTERRTSSVYSSEKPFTSPLSKLLTNRRESDLSSTTKEQQQQQTAPRIREISSNVGFVSLPDQVRRRAIKKGFEFNLMVVGKVFL